MASERVNPIDCSHLLPSLAVPPELHVLHCVNAGYKVKDLLEQLGHEQVSIAMPGQLNVFAANQGLYKIFIYMKIYKMKWSEIHRLFV